MPDPHRFPTAAPTPASPEENETVQSGDANSLCQYRLVGAVDHDDERDSREGNKCDSKLISLVRHPCLAGGLKRSYVPIWIEVSGTKGNYHGLLFQ